ncbi:sulfatase family protein [Kineococcus arenarius]|uniref:sulfatase family protein n=1 Tax=unclassified Kineococcus TaxID=2621656 RepID=UPI003D7E7783
MTGRPNVLWISTHDINPHLGAYAGVYPGADYARTPNLDRLAAEGMRFDKAFAAAPICAPSRSAIFTGCFPTAIGTMHMRTKAAPPPEVRLFTEHLREAGYYTTNNSFTDFQVNTPASAFDDCSGTAHWRNRPSPDTPFFAAFHGMTTHESQIYLDDEAFLRRTSHVGDDDRHDPALAPLPPYYPDTEVFRRCWARYNDLITEMDHWVGELLAQLEEDGLAEDTIVVFWSDHGLGMPRGKRWANDSGLHEPLIVRWPGRVAAGSAYTDPVHLMDLAPTTLALCGVEVPAHVHGRPFLHADGRPVPAPNEYVFAGRDRQGETEDRTRSARDGRYRYLRHHHPDRSPMQHCDYPDHLATWAEFRRFAAAEAGQLAKGERPSLLTPLQRRVVAASKPAEELYDLLEDPYEEHDLAADPAHAATLERFRAAVDGWLAEFGDLGELAEVDLLERWRPGGVWPVAAVPELGPGGGAASATCATAGASVVWTTDPPREQAHPAGRVAGAGGMGEATGAPVQDGRHWWLLCAATPPPADVPVWLKACRTGCLDSGELPVPARLPSGELPVPDGVPTPQWG